MLVGGTLQPTSSAETLPGYGQCDGSGGLTWLSESRPSLVVAPGKSVTVDVKLDSAEVDQPGSYQAMLYASADTPYPVQVTSLTMKVKPSAAMHELSGTVTTASGTPINDATVAITSGSASGRTDIAAAGRGTSSAQATAAVKTDPTGHWQWWLTTGHGPVQVSAAKDGYQPQAATVMTSRTPTTVNFALKPDPGSLPYTSASAASPGRSQANAVHRRSSRTARGTSQLVSAEHGSSAGRSGLPADVRAVCGKPAVNYAACMVLARTNVKPHKGLFGPDATPAGYGPSDLQSAYDLPSGTAGSGQTVAVVDAYGDPDAEADLQVYRAQYGLPVCDTANGCFEKVNQKGQQGHYPANDPSWAEEESLDVDMVSAICPNCHIILVEANSASVANLGTSVDEAVKLGAKYVSNSYGTNGSEPSGETSHDKYYNHPGVAVTASAGDSGYGVHYPAASQYVTSVGGTTLTQDPSSARGWTETVWGSSSGGEGTGSGCSAYEPKPAWQLANLSATDSGCTKRTVADVSADADPNTGVALYDSDGKGGWNVVGGTSVSSPVIASTFALAGTPAAGTYPSSYPYVNASGTLNDVTSGANGTCTPAYLCTAGPGYDGPTGLGTPDGISAFTAATYGTVAGTVTNTATSAPLAGATVTVGNLSATTDSSGNYTLDVGSGSYAVKATDYGYAAQTATGVQVSGGQTTSQNFALTAAPGTVTLSGTVTDGSGHKWPLYAKITVPGTPLAPVYTNPDTGKYSLTIAADATYTLDVAPVYPGYLLATSTVSIGTKNVTENVKPVIDTAACTAPGYAPNAAGSCGPLPGGLVTGVVRDANTGDGVNGATIAETGKHGGTGTSEATGDPAIPGGFYWLFSPAGTHTLSATDGGYAAATATVDVKANQVTSQDWSLQAGHLTVTPASTSATVPLGQSQTVKLTYTNTGTAPLQVTLGEQDSGFTPTSGQSGARRINAARATSGWTNIAPYPIPIYNNAMAYDPQDGDLYSIGGSTTSSLTLTSASYVYDPSAETWSPIASAPQALYGAEAAFTDGTLYLVGGETGSPSSTLALSSAVYAYDPGSNTWSQVASLPQGAYSPGLAVLDGQLYVVGGCPTTAPYCGPPALQGVYRYDPQDNTWTQLADYPIPTSQEACGGIDGEVVCAGGVNVDGHYNSTGETYLYDPASNTWSQGADLPYFDYGMAYSAANGKLQVAGGIAYGSADQGGGNFSARVSQYNPATNTWSALPSLPSPEFGTAGACGMYMVGGYGPDSSYKPVPTAQVLPGYDQCDGSGDTGWLSPNQDSFALVPGASVTVKVRLDSAEVTQPGTYQAALYATTNTPYPVQVTDVTMAVTPPAGWSLLSGTVTDASGNPIAGSTVQVDTSASSVKSGQVDYTLITSADGTYQWWLNPSADDPLQVIAAKDGYVQQVATVQQPGSSLDFALNPFPSVPY